MRPPPTRGIVQPLRGSVVPPRMSARLGGQPRPASPAAQPFQQWRVGRAPKPPVGQRAADSKRCTKRWCTGAPRLGRGAERPRSAQVIELRSRPSLDNAIHSFLAAEPPLPPPSPPEATLPPPPPAPPHVVEPAFTVGVLPPGIFDHLEPNYKALAAWERWRWWPLDRPHPLALLAEAAAASGPPAHGGRGAITTGATRSGT